LRDNQVIFTSNFANSAGCAWQGIGGQVFGLDGLEIRGMQIHVFTPDGRFDQTTPTGSNSLYGQNSGWEVRVDNQINNLTYLVELRSAGGTPVSQPITVQFPQDCAANLALVRFVQERPF